MRKIVFLVCAFFCFLWDRPDASASAHLEKIKTAYPYGLLGEDFDLLTLDDLAFNACVSVPRPISDKSDAYPYWQCFNTEDVHFECDHAGKQTPGSPVQALLALVIMQASNKVEYLAPGIMDLNSCKAYESDWARLTKGEKHVCISGPLIRFDEDKNREYDAHWTFDKFKTRKGCVAYFDGYCNVKRKQSPCEDVSEK